MRILPAALLLLLLSGSAAADRMVIVPYSSAGITEPGQKALIGFDGRRQILVLTTVLSSREPQEVLEVLPLPGEPRVAGLAPDFLTRLEALASEVSPTAVATLRGQPAIEVTAQHRVGCHDITVLRVRNASELNGFVADYYARRGRQVRRLSPAEVRLAEDYVEQGCGWLVLDRVELTGEATRVDPVLYEFESDRLFYPMRTSNLVGHSGVVDLLVLTRQEVPGLRLAFRDCVTAPEDVTLESESDPESSWDTWFTWWDVYADLWTSRSRPVSAQELQALDPALGMMFPAGAVLQGYRYLGPLNFKSDLWCPPAKPPRGP
ncbi:MAG: DUF2330 domain-containing protein [Candidatus Eremiobacterota bacterium]